MMVCETHIVLLTFVLTDVPSIEKVWWVFVLVQASDYE